MKLPVMSYAAVALIAFTGPASAQVERYERIIERKTVVRPIPTAPDSSEPTPTRDKGFRQVRTDDRDSFRVGGMTLHRNTPCELNVTSGASGIPPFSYEGLCTVTRDGKTTGIKAGRARLIIQRLPDDNTIARLALVDVFGDTHPLGNAIAEGGCWRRRGFTFCAQ